MWRQRAVDAAAIAARGMKRYRRRLRVWSVCVLAIVGYLVLGLIFPERMMLPALTATLGAGVVLVIFLAALGCEYIDSALGMGYGTTLTPILLLAGFEPVQVVPAVLLSEFVTGLAAGCLHHRDGNVDFLRDRRAQGTAVLLTLLSVAGAALAVTVALTIPKFWLTAIIGAIVLSVGVLIILTVKRQLRYRPWHIVTIGGIAAFNKALSGGGYGPLVTGGQVVGGISSKNAVAITSLAESLTCLIGLIAYGAVQRSIYWPLAIPLVAGALLSVPLATLTVKRIPETLMRGSVGVATCLLGTLMFVKLIW